MVEFEKWNELQGVFRVNGIWIIVVLLLAAAVGLLIASFFKKDSGNQLQEEVEELSLDMLHDIHIMKQRVSYLEREMGFKSPQEVTEERVLGITKNQVVKLYTRGLTVDQIAAELKLNSETAQAIIDAYISEGLE